MHRANWSHSEENEIASHLEGNFDHYGFARLRLDLLRLPVDQGALKSINIEIWSVIDG